LLGDIAHFQMNYKSLFQMTSIREVTRKKIRGTIGRAHPHNKISGKCS
jgi:hypothetical protein